MTVTLDRLADITLEDAWKVGFEKEPVAFSDRASDRIRDGRQGYERLMAGDGARFVYGSTTEPGVRATVRLSAQQQAANQRAENRWAPIGFGGGGVKLPERVVRLIVLARVAGYIEGHGRIRLETAAWVADLLSREIPDIPLDSATGPGEVMPLSWLYPALGEVDLAGGELMALYNGSPCATALVTDAALTAGRRLDLTERVLALAVEAVAAPLDPYDPALAAVTADPFHKAVLGRLDALLAGVPTTGRQPHQGPVSWRIVPTVLAAAARACEEARQVAEESLRSAAHNPVYLPPDDDHPDGRALSPGGFHNQPASRAIDGLNAAGADLCALAAKQTGRLLDGAPFGLPRLLVPEGSGVIGTEFLAWSQTGHAERARQAAMPAVLSIGLEDPGGAQSDVASPVFLAYERHMVVSEALDRALATLSFAVAQAFRLTGRRPPPGLAAFLSALDAAVPPFDLDHIGTMGGPLQALTEAYGQAVLGRGEFADLLAGRAQSSLTELG